MTQDMGEQVTWQDLGISFGKTYPEPSAPTEDRTSKPSSRRSSASSSRKRPMCLCLRKDGPTAGCSAMRWEDGALLGEYTTRSFGESPNAAVESRLSQILEECPHPKYSLSERACLGILRRAEKRGKELPEELKNALLRQCGSGGCLESDD